MREYILVTMLCSLMTGLWVVVTTKDRSSWFYIKVVAFSIVIGPVVPWLTFFGMPSAIRSTFKD
jgi:hypothetical protein